MRLILDTWRYLYLVTMAIKHLSDTTSESWSISLTTAGRHLSGLHKCMLLPYHSITPNTSHMPWSSYMTEIIQYNIHCIQLRWWLRLKVEYHESYSEFIKTTPFFYWLRKIIDQNLNSKKTPQISLPNINKNGQSAHLCITREHISDFIHRHKFSSTHNPAIMIARWTANCQIMWASPTRSMIKTHICALMSGASYCITHSFIVSVCPQANLTTPMPIFCHLLRVSSGCAQLITGQVTSVTWPVIGCA